MSSLIMRVTDSCDRLKVIHKNVQDYTKMFSLAKCKDMDDYDQVLAQLRNEFRNKLDNDQVTSHAEFLLNFLCKPMWKLQLDSYQKKFYDKGSFYVEDVVFIGMHSESTLIEQWVNVLHIQDENMNLFMEGKGCYQQVDLSEESMEVSQESIVIDD